MNHKLQHFLQTIHSIWLTDSLDMSEYMDFLDAYMLRHGVRFKEVRELDSENLLRAIEMNMETHEIFEYDVNDMSKDVFANFKKVCDTYFDYSNISLQNKVA